MRIDRMKRPWTAALPMALIVGLLAGCGRSGGSAPAGKGGTAAAAGGTMTISDIMQQVNKRKGGIHSDVGEALRAEPIDWAGVQAKTSEYARLAAMLGANDPPKGDKPSWESLTKTYADNAKALHAAAEKSDKDGALGVHRTLQQSCMQCHKAHKE